MDDAVCRSSARWNVHLASQRASSVSSCAVASNAIATLWARMSTMLTHAQRILMK